MHENVCPRTHHITQPSISSSSNPGRRKVLGMLDPLSRCVLARFLFTTFLCVYQYWCVFHRSLRSTFLSSSVIQQQQTILSVIIMQLFHPHLFLCASSTNDLVKSTNLQISYSAFTHVVMYFFVNVNFDNSCCYTRRASLYHI